MPLIVVHPEARGGQRCKALTSHLDLAPTLMRMAGAQPTSAMKGRDLSPLLEAPESAALDALRTGTLFNYNMLAYLDGDFLRAMKELRDAKKAGKVAAAVGVAAAAKPALEKRGAIRSWFDGRYRFTRYFSPREHHLPGTLGELLAHNDVEVFDLETDPHEVDNLALHADEHAELIGALNARLNELITEEVGKDDGSMLPLSKRFDWDLDAMDA